VNGARDEILGSLRGALKRGPLAPDAARALDERVAAHRRNPVPQRAAALDHAGRIALFVAMAEEVQATVARVASRDAVPEEVARYLVAENLPAELVMAPDPALDEIPWSGRPLLCIRRGRAKAVDTVSLTPCLAAIAETGTLMLVSGPGTPTTLNFLPDTHIVLVRADQVVASYEDGWDLVRARSGPGNAAAEMPRTINFITGPSRTGDIEQRIQLGAHGPRRLHIILIGEASATRHGQGGARNRQTRGRR
jgi:L-lactate dehydrogenase complex protein LldG